MVHRRVLVLGLALFVLTAAGVALGVTAGGGHHSHPARPVADSPVAVAGSPAAYGFLVTQTSNQCGLQADRITSMPAAMHLQGSCCSRMDERSYRAQVDYLRRHRIDGAIPKDPYDIPVALVQRMLGYDHSVRLNRVAQATYRRAMAMASEKGPCCCRCWRWDAFRGLSKHLIVVRRISAHTLALLIGALDGCGGRADQVGGRPV